MVDILTGEHPEILDAITLPGRIRFDAQRQAFQKWFAGIVGESGSEQLVRVLQMLRSQPEIVSQLREEADVLTGDRLAPLQNWFRSIADVRRNDSVVHVSDDDRSDLRRIVGESSPASRWPCFFSLDLMIAGRDVESINRREFRLVIGEVHPSIGVNGYYSALYGDREALKGELEELLTESASGLQPVNFLTPAYNKTFVSTDLSFPDIEYTAPAAADKQRIDISDLYLTCRSGEVSLVAAGIARPLFIYNKLPQLMGLIPLSVFTHPLCSTVELAEVWQGERTHVPRLQFGPVVLFRETWKTTVGEMRGVMSAASAHELFCRAQELRDNGMPRRVFVRPDGESKPLYVDFDNWFLLDMLQTRLNRLPESARVTITEMCPDVDALWFRDSQGRKTCEFRFAFFEESK